MDRAEEGPGSPKAAEPELEPAGGCLRVSAPALSLGIVELTSGARWLGTARSPPRGLRTAHSSRVKPFLIPAAGGPGSLFQGSEVACMLQGQTPG